MTAPTAKYLTLWLVGFALASCGSSNPPRVDWPKVVYGAAELGVLAQRHGQTVIVCLVGEAPKAVLMDAPSGAQQPSGAAQDGAP
jgi:hypothetical protein